MKPLGKVGPFLIGSGACFVFSFSLSELSSDEEPELEVFPFARLDDGGLSETVSNLEQTCQAICHALLPTA